MNNQDISEQPRFEADRCKVVKGVNAEEVSVALDVSDVTQVVLKLFPKREDFQRFGSMSCFSTDSFFQEATVVAVEGRDAVDDAYDPPVQQFRVIEDDGIEEEDDDVYFRQPLSDDESSTGEEEDVDILEEVPRVGRTLSCLAKNFIPRYNISMDMATILRCVGDETDPTVLAAAGYPAYIVRRIRASVDHSTSVLRYPRRKRDPVGSMAGFYDEEKDRQVTGTSHSSYELGEVSKFWRIPTSRSAVNVPKPLYYSHSAFRQWVYGQTAVLLKEITRKTQMITGNDACRSLWFASGAMTQGTANQLLSKACVYIHDFRAADREPNPLVMSSFVDFSSLPTPRKSLQIGGTTVSSLEELMRFEANFVRHKPIWRRAVSYFTGDSVVDVDQLQGSLFRHFPSFRPEGKTCSIPCVEKVPPAPLFIGRTRLTSLDDLMKWKDSPLQTETLFLWEMCISHFQGEGIFDHEQIQEDLNTFFSYVWCSDAKMRRDVRNRRVMTMWGQPISNIFEARRVSQCLETQGFAHVATCLVKYYENPWFCDPDLLQVSLAVASKVVVRKEGRCNPCNFGDFPRDFKVDHQLLDTVQALPKDFTLNLKCDFLESIEGMFQTDRPSGMRVCFNVASFLTNLFYATSWQAVLSSVAMFISGSAANIKYCKEVALQVIGRLSEVIVREGEGDSIFSSIRDSLHGFWEVIISASLLTFLSEIKGELIGTIGPIVMDLVYETKRAIIREKAVDMAKNVVSWIKDAFGRIVECVKTKSLDPLWGSKWDPKAWTRQAEGLKGYYTLLTVQKTANPDVTKEIGMLRDLGVLGPEWTVPVSVDMYLSRVQAHLDQGAKIKAYFSLYPPITNEIARQSSILTSFYDTIRVQGNGSNSRVKPMFVFLYGKPGVGKSNLMYEMSNAIAKANALPSDSKSIYHWTMGANFQDGFDHTKTTVFIDDADTSPAPLAAGVRNIVEDIQMLVNNTAYPVEQARVDMKGVVFANPLLVFQASNYLGGRASSFSLCPDAYYRRMDFHVEVKVKPEFALPDGRLDADKAAQSQSHDMWDLHVRYYRKTDNVQDFLTDATVYSFTEFMVLFQERFRANLIQQNALLNRRAFSGGFCGTCGLSLHKNCSCPPIGPFELEGRSQRAMDFIVQNWTGSRTFRASTIAEYYGNEYPHGQTMNELCSVYRLVRMRLHDPNCDFRRSSLDSFFLIPQGLRDRFEELVEEIEAQLLDDGDLWTDRGDTSPKPWYLRFRQQMIVNFYASRRSSIREFYEAIPLVQRFTITYCCAVVGIITVLAGLEFVITKIFASKRLEARELNAGNSLAPPNWFKADQTFTPGVPKTFGQSTFTYDDAVVAIKDSHVEIWDSNGLFCHGFCVAHNMVLTVTHVMNCTDVFVMQNGTRLPLRVSTDTMRILPSSKELSVFLVSGLKGTLGICNKMWAEVDESIQQFDEIHVMQPALKYKPSHNCVAMVERERALVTDFPSTYGDCGSVYLARHGSNWKVVAMHFGSQHVTGAFHQTHKALGGLVTAGELRAIVMTMGTKLEGVVPVLSVISRDPDFIVGRFGAKSEILSAIANHGAHVHQIGELHPPLPGSTMKTKMKWSIMIDDLRELEVDLCGMHGYWKMPLFRGEMLNAIGEKDPEGKWESAFSNMFKTQNRANPDTQLMKLALYDYLSGMEQLDTQGYATLSEEATISGVPGSYVHAVNMKTSVGPPFIGSKRAHVVCNAGDSYISPDVARTIDEVEAVLEHSIPSVVCVCSLKDEPMKHTKKWPRVFNNLPFAINFLMKKYGAGWKSFVRANFAFFESAVGINMTSVECEKVLNFLQRVAELDGDMYDGDIIAMDKSFNAEFFLFVALVVYAVSWLIGIDADKNWRLCMSMQHVTYYVKGDLFRGLFNPSGHDQTVEYNGFAVSLGERYVHYRTNPYKGDWGVINKWFATFFTNPIPLGDQTHLTFRKKVGLVTYGDDNLKGMKPGPAPDYGRIWKEELGFVMTDAATKEEVLTEKSVETISFLKRSFRFLPEANRWVAALDHKSMARMVMFKRDSSLTDIDHAAVTSSEFLRECVYHGREFYEKYLTFFNGLAQKYGFSQNPYYAVKMYDERIEEIRAGTFQTWNLREPCAPISLSTNPITLEAMSQAKLVKASNFDVQQPTTTVGSAVSHDTGVITNTAGTVQTSQEVNPVFFQKMPTNELSDFLLRATYLTEYTLTGTDAPGFMDDFSPWELFLGNPYVQEKLANYTYIRGTLQVIAVVTVPGLAYGAYVLSALPQGRTTTTGVAPGLIFENCCQVDEYAIIDLANSTNSVFQLAWIAETDYLNIRTGITPAETWSITLSCLVPVSTAIAGGVTNASVRIYGNLMPDYQLVVPHFEGRRKLQANAAMKQYAPDVHAAIGEGRGSAMMGKVASVAEAASKLPIIGPFAETAGMAARGAEAILSYFGFTRQSRELAPIPIVQNSVTNVAHCDGDDSGQGASLMFMNEVSIDPTLTGFGSEDCLATADLFPRWTIVKSFSWSPIDDAGEVLAEIPVTPSYNRFQGASEGLRLQMTTAGYFGLPFEYWRGDMEYMIVIPVSKVHRGVLQVIWVPLDSSPVGDVTNVSLNLIMDITTGSTKNLTVGFAREIPFLHNRIMHDSMTFPPVGASNGYLMFRVINSLSAPSATAHTMVYVFARAKENMTFAMPRDEFLHVGLDTLPVMYNIQSQIRLEGALGDDDPVEPDVMTLVPSSGPYPSDKILFGEQVTSVRALLQKPSKLNTLSQNGSKNYPSFLWTPGSLATAGGVLTVWTWQGYYRALFLGLACSERLKILPRTEAWIGASKCIRSSGSLPITSVNPTLSPMTFCGPNKGAEFNIPYYHNTKYMLGRENLVIPNPGAKIKLSVYPVDSESVEYISYYSFGPDIRATCFRQVPNVMLLGTADPTYREWWAT